MSLCLFLMTEDSVYIGTDSAITVDGKRSVYEQKKINQLNDGKLLFIAGTVETSIKVNIELSKYDEITVEHVQKLLREHLQSELERDEELRDRFNEGKDVISAFLFTPGRKTYLMPAQSNFDVIEIDSYVEPGSIKVHAAGYDVKKAYDEAVRLATNGKGLTPAYILNKAFEHVSGAQVGGHLTITRINDSGVHMSEPRKIKETLRFELTDKPLVSTAHAIASEVIGGVVRGANITTNEGTYPYCEMSSDNNVFKAAKSPTSYLEIEANPSSYAGPIIKHVDGNTVAFNGAMGGDYFSLVANGDYDIGAHDGALRINAGNTQLTATQTIMNSHLFIPTGKNAVLGSTSHLLFGGTSLSTILNGIYSRLSALESK